MTSNTVLSAKQTVCDLALAIQGTKTARDPLSLLELWYTLPEEIKERILKYVVRIGSQIPYYVVEKNIEAKGTFSFNRVATLFLPPRFKISHIAREIWYKGNDIHVDLRDSQMGAPILYPAPAFNQFIRCLLLTLSVTQRDWLFVKKIASGHLGFGALRKMTMNFKIRPEQLRNTNDIEAALATVDRTPLAFNLKTLRIEFYLDKDVYLTTELASKFTNIKNKIFSQTSTIIAAAPRAPEIWDTQWELPYPHYVSRNIKY